MPGPSASRGLLASFIDNRGLIYQLTRRALIGRYRGSVAGVGWSLFIPIMMLAVYTFVFGFIFRMRFDQDGGTSNLDFAGFLFTGIVVHGFLAECLNRSPGLVANSAQYVKKIVFPLESLAWVAVFTALFQTSISTLVLALFLLLTQGGAHASWLLAPLVLAPLLVLASGLVWTIGAISVYLKDFAQLMGVLVTLMLFLGPVFYPLSAVPEPFRYVLYLNPVSFVIEQMRVVMLEGRAPDWIGLLIYFVIAAGISRVGLALFNRMRRGFADVL